MSCYVKKTVEKIISICKTNNPYDIAAQSNITVHYEDLGDVLGYYNTFKRTSMIHVHYNLEDIERRFVAAHELGHCFLHPKLNTPFMKRHTLFSTDRIEREANQFAVELLLPDELIREQSLEFVTLENLASTYGVPQEIVHLKNL